MSVEYIDRTKDEEIINLIRDILSNASFIVETIDESILVKLMEARRTPIKNYKTMRNMDRDYNEVFLQKETDLSVFKHEKEK